MPTVERPECVPQATPAPRASTASDTSRIAVASMEWGIVLAVSAVVLLLEIPAAIHRPLWFDELSTLFMTWQPTLADMFHAIPTDGNPPLYFLLARIFLHLPVSTELAMRLPSILAFNATAIAVYIFVRRVASFPAAMLSMCLVLGSFIGQQYAIEARAYTLLLLCAMAQLCSWQEYRRGSRKTAALAGVAISAACAVLTHQYGLIYVAVPLLAGEVTAWIENRKIDPRPLAAMVAGAVPTLAYTIPTMLSGQRGLLQMIRTAPHFWARPHAYLLDQYIQVFPVFASGLAVIAGVVWLAIIVLIPQSHRVSTQQAESYAPELAAADLLLLFVPLMMTVTAMGTGYFLPRYGLGASIGMAMVCGLLAQSGIARWPKFQTIAYLPAAYAIVLAAARFYLIFHPVLSYNAREELVARAPADLPIVVENALEFSPAWWYSDASMRPRLHYLSDLDYTFHNSDPLPEYCLEWEKQYTPMHMDAYSAFIATHPKFLIFSDGQPRLEWVRTRLAARGWSVEPLEKNDSGRLYLATHRRNP